ncbi:MAG: alkyl hydroperoxide reductase [Glaciihabitans sp.]|nr:alkyl hydroperoxide reductase [Glaciihabitans sp.]
MRPKRLLGAFVAAPVAAAVIGLLLAGCTETPDLGASTQGYISGSGVYKEILPADRKKPLSFTAKLDTGGTVSSAALLGKVHVLNFWYAGCVPCNSEASRLESSYNKYKSQVGFLGVNTYDQAPTSLTFEQTHGVTYPSAIDANTASVQFAFSSYIPPSAVPTTLVLDREGRVAARVTGEIESTDILNSLIKTVLAEGK